MTHFEFTRGNPTPEEIAIAITVLRAASGAQESTLATRLPSRHSWAAPIRQHRRTLHEYGNGAWVLANRIR